MSTMLTFFRDLAAEGPRKGATDGDLTWATIEA